jgi:hypothetical protein
LDDVRCNCLSLRQAARKVTQFYDEVLAGARVRTTQYSILQKRPKAMSTDGGAVAASWTISSSSAKTRSTPVASVIFRLSARRDNIFWVTVSLEHAKINPPTLPPANSKLSSSQLAAMANPIE